MLAKVAMHMRASKTTLGFDPAALSTLDAVMTSNLVFERTAAMVKPPSKRPMVGENIRSSLPSVVRSTPSVTVRNGTKKLVTKSGIAWNAA
jgi:hypothetical protein